MKNLLLLDQQNMKILIKNKLIKLKKLKFNIINLFVMLLKIQIKNIIVNIIIVQIKEIKNLFHIMLVILNIWMMIMIKKLVIQ